MNASRIADIESRLGEIGRERARLIDELRTLRRQRMRTGMLDGLSVRTTPRTPSERIALFAELFAARRDIFPRLWENVATGKKGYSPVCETVWEGGRRLKPSEIFARYGRTRFLPLSDAVIESHLRGQHVIGTYAIRPDDTCTFLAADFDAAGWRDDVVGYREEAAALGASAYIEISRSGDGAHAWIFFATPVPAVQARRLGSLILAKEAARSAARGMDSYDRLFPNQDKLPKGGFGNLIALPLQRKQRESGRTVFVDENLCPFPDQWAMLASVDRLSPDDLGRILEDNLGADTQDAAEDLELEDLILESSTPRCTDYPPIPDRTLHLAEQLIVPTKGLPSAMQIRIRRLATFPNPVFFERQRQRFPTYDTPKYIFAGEVLDDAIVLPRGCREALIETFAESGSRANIEDRRLAPRRVDIGFTGQLRPAQERAVEAMRPHEHGILVAPPGTGKTVMACALMACRKTPSLVLVNRQALLDQWIERIGEFLGLARKEIGALGGSRRKLKGRIDVAMMQTLANREDSKEIFRSYGMVVVDECHHVPAVSFEQLMKTCGSRFILGLTATPRRKDGLDRLLHFQCGPIRHVLADLGPDLARKVFLHETRFNAGGSADPIPLHMLWARMIADTPRNRMIARDIVAAASSGRAVLVLSDRKEHLSMLASETTSAAGIHAVCIDGSLSRNVRADRVREFGQSLAAGVPACLFATAALLGEGFDLPRLDTLVLAMPISFKGRLIQYAGRLHRVMEGKHEIHIHDYLDTNLAIACSMYRKRLPGYREMGYAIDHAEAPPDDTHPRLDFG